MKTANTDGEIIEIEFVKGKQVDTNGHACYQYSIKLPQPAFSALIGMSIEDSGLSLNQSIEK